MKEAKRLLKLEQIKDLYLLQRAGVGGGVSMKRRVMSFGINVVLSQCMNVRGKDM